MGIRECPMCRVALLSPEPFEFFSGVEPGQKCPVCRTFYYCEGKGPDAAFISDIIAASHVAELHTIHR